MASGMSISLRSGGHVDLPSQQRRLRHLRSISARNLTLSDNEDTLLDTFFTLHVPGRNQEFYRSEVICKALNPDWAALDPHSMTNKTDTAIPAFQIKVWALIVDETVLVIDWLVDLGALTYVGERVLFDSTTCGSNSLIFGMFNGYYVAPPEHYSRLSREALEASLSLKTLLVNRSSIKSSYTKWNLISLVEKCQQLNCLHGDIVFLKESIRHRIETGAAGGNNRQQHEVARVRIRLLKDDYNRQAIQERSESMALERLKQTVAEKASSLKQSQSELNERETQLTNMRQTVTSKHNALYGLNARLSFRRCSLLCQLMQIFPIRKFDDHCEILGIKLPDAGSYSSSDDDAVAAALGYVSQLVLIVSRILCVTLTHQVTAASSFSYIRDDIRNDLEGEEREFQLFARTKNRDRFGYGVYLVNDNIRLVRQICGLPTNDMRMTLNNILDLFQLFSHHNSRPAQSRSRDIPFFTPPPATAALPPPHYTSSNISDSSRQQWLQSSDLPPPYEAIVSQPTREHSLGARAAATNPNSGVSINKERENAYRPDSPLVINSTGSSPTACEQTGEKEDNRKTATREEKQLVEREDVRDNARDLAPTKDTTSSTEQSRDMHTPSATPNDVGDSDWALDDVLVVNRNEEKEEVSGHSPSLMRGKTRLAGIGFGAKAAARGLRPNVKQRQQRKPGRFLVNDQLERQGVGSIGERADSREHACALNDDGTRRLHEGRGDSDASDSSRAVATTS